ncbi:hypothetical protein CRENBAI_016840 [Crenichthys baileyi]|uniref:Uncharacterized protein n=1 Tax=Crenichthys baileyi TaxID=28760 RepID=A0AAV9RF21_9TELE
MALVEEESEYEWSCLLSVQSRGKGAAAARTLTDRGERFSLRTLNASDCRGFRKVLMLLHSHQNPLKSRNRRKNQSRQPSAVLVLTRVSIIGSRHNHYSWCVAAAELLMTQCLSGCACQVSLTTVAVREEEEEGES